MTAGDMRTLHPRDRRAWPSLPSVLPVGSWICTEEGVLRVEDDGTVTPRPTPIPWSRPSIAAEPWATGRQVA